MNQPKFDLSKCPRNDQGHYLCQTSDNPPKPVRVVCMDAIDGDSPKLLILMREGECESAFFALPSGEFWDCHVRRHLVNIPEKIKRTVWLNIFKGDHCEMGYNNKEDADSACRHFCTHRIACVPVTVEFEHGEGL